jgi:hypothetical protein
MHTKWINARIYMFDEVADEFDNVLSTLSGSDVTYYSVAFLAAFDVEYWQVWSLNAIYRSTGIQMDAPIPDNVTDDQLADFIERLESLTSGSLKKSVVGFLELRDEATFEKLKSAITANAVLSEGSIVELA